MDGYDNEELTAAELEDLRRERAAARRRKLAARERRRKKRRRQAIIRCSILLLILILIITGIVKMISGIWKHFHKNKTSDKITEQMADSTTEEPTTEEIKATIDDGILAKELPADREAALSLLQAQSASDPDIKSIYDNAAVYPDKVLQCLAINSEMKQFVMDYPTKINIVFDGSFNVEVTENEVPLFLQFDEQWGYADYGNNIIGINGCGPTCLSMAYTYLKQDGSMNPIKVADFSVSAGYLNESGDTDWTLMTDGARTLGLISEEIALSKENMTSALEEGKVIICSMSPGDFTRDGHFILIRDYKDGLFYVNDPNSEARSNVGWDYERLSNQISNMWALSAGNGDTGQTGNPENSNDSNATTQANQTDNQTDNQTGSQTDTPADNQTEN